MLGLTRRGSCAALAIALALAGAALAGDRLRSGPQAGQKMVAFDVEDVTGPNKGKTVCYVWKYGLSPVTLVFARGLSDALVGLIKEVNAAVAQDPAKKLRAFVAFLHEPDDVFKAELAELAAREKLAIPLVVPVARPPQGYPLADEAAATVLVYDHHNIKNNFALREGEIDEKAVAEIVAAAKHARE